MNKPLVGISSCLTGQKVRYDGDHRFHQCVHNHIQPHVTLLPLCPEAAIGMGIPRPPIQVRQSANGLQAVGRDNPDIDVTEGLTHFADTIHRVYTGLCGYIFQSRSPSCGYLTTPIFDEYGIETGLGSGLVAQRLSDACPDLPIVNDTELRNQREAEAFLHRVMERFKAFS